MHSPLCQGLVHKQRERGLRTREKCLFAKGVYAHILDWSKKGFDDAIRHETLS